MSNVSLFTAKATDGDSALFVATGDGKPGAMLQTTIEVYGEFDGCSVQLYWKARDGIFYPTQDAPWTASDIKYAELNSNSQYKLVVSGVGASTEIGATAYNAAGV